MLLNVVNVIKLQGSNVYVTIFMVGKVFHMSFFLNAIKSLAVTNTIYNLETPHQHGYEVINHSFIMTTYLE